MATQKETLQLLCKSIITRLENQKAISLPARLRKVVQEEVYHLVSPFILTDEDLKEKILSKIGAKAELLQDTGFTDSEQYRAAQSAVRNLFATEEMNGFYFQKSPQFMASTIVEYLMRSSHIDDVFETDEDLERQIIDIVKKFNFADAH